MIAQSKLKAKRTLVTNSHLTLVIPASLLHSSILLTVYVKGNIYIRRIRWPSYCIGYVERDGLEWRSISHWHFKYRGKQHIILWAVFYKTIVFEVFVSYWRATFFDYFIGLSHRLCHWFVIVKCLLYVDIFRGYQYGERPFRYVCRLHGNVKPKWYSSMHRPTLGRQWDFSDMVSPFFVPIPFNLIQYFIYLSNGPASCNASLPVSCNASRKRANRSCMKSEHLFWGQLYLKDHAALVKNPYLSYREERKVTGKLFHYVCEEGHRWTPKSDGVSQSTFTGQADIPSFQGPEFFSMQLSLSLESIASLTTQKTTSANHY